MNNTIDNRLQLKQEFDNLVPTTMEGNSIYNKYVEILKDVSNPVTAYTNLINESLASKDAHMIRWATKIQKEIMENHMNVWNFSLLLEKYESENSPIYEKVIDELKYLKSYDSKMFEHCVKNGALNEYIGFQDIKNFNAQINNIHYTKRINESNIQFHPLSYFDIVGEDVIFMLESKAYKYNKNKGIMETQIPSQTFVDVNNAIQEVPYNVDNDEYDMTYLVGNVNVTNKGKVYLDKEPIALQDLQNKIEQSIKEQPIKVQLEESRKFDTLSLLVENWHKMIKFDNIHGIKNTINESCIYLLEHENGSRYLIDKTGIIKYSDSIVECLQEIKNYMNVDISESFKESIYHEIKINNKIGNIHSLIESEIIKYDNKIAELKEELSFMNEGSEQWNDAQELIKLCEDGRQALILNK